MDTFSTRQAAKVLGIGLSTLSRYIAAGKIPAPRTVQLGGLTVHAWTEREIERARKLIPKIQNGRHLRYQKQRKEKGKKPL
jgi:excisionase family DNA binding protein